MGCYFAGLYADVRWAGEEDLVNDPKLLSLRDNYLKTRQGSLRNIAFNANATGGGEIKIMRDKILTICFRNDIAVQHSSCDGWYWERHIRPD